MSFEEAAAKDGRPYRYPGAHHFDESSAGSRLFYGRKDDTSALLYQVLAEDFVVVFGSSGHGKSSLIRAGLLRPLREKDYFPVVARLADDERNPTAAITQAVKSSAAATGVECSAGSEATLWHFFMTLTLSRAGRELTPVLILDQFEELFTIVDPGPRRSFVDEFADLVRGTRPRDVKTDPELLIGSGRPRVKVVISIRGDFLFELESLPRNIPQVFHSRYRVLPLRRAQAEEAIIRPAQDTSDIWAGRGPFEWSREAVDEVLDFLCELEGSLDRRAHVNPFVLQLLCQYAERSVIAGDLESPIAPGWIQKLTGIDSTAGAIEGFNRILVEYYEHCVRTAPHTRLRVGNRIRDLCERRLISSDGYRLTLDSRSAGQLVSLEELEHLERERLVSSHLRGDTRYYELSHDGLVRAVFLARERRKQRQRTIVRRTLQVAAAVLLIAIPTQFDDWRDVALVRAATEILDRHPEGHEVARALLGEVSRYAQPDWAAAAKGVMVAGTPSLETGRNQNAATVLAIGPRGLVVTGAGDGFAAWDLQAQGFEAPKVWPGDSIVPGVTNDLRVVAASESGWFGLGFDGGGVVHWRPPDSPMFDTEHNDPVRAVTISADGKRVASADEGGRIQLADYWELDARYSDAARSGSIMWALAFNSDGGLLASVTRDGIIDLWDVSDGELTTQGGTLDAGKTGGVNVPFMDFGGPEGNTLVVIRRAGPSWLVDVSGDSFADSVDIGTIRQAALSPDRSRLIAMTQEGEIRIKQLPDGGDVGTVREHGGIGNARWVTMIDSLDGPKQPFVAATSRTDGTVRLWEGTQGGGLSGRYVEIFDQASRGLLVPRDSTTHALVTGSSDGLVKIYDLRDLAPLLDIERVDQDSADFQRLKVTMNQLPGHHCLDAEVKSELAGLRTEGETQISLGWSFPILDLGVRLGRLVWHDDLQDCAE